MKSIRILVPGGLVLAVLGWAAISAGVSSPVPRYTGSTSQGGWVSGTSQAQNQPAQLAHQYVKATKEDEKKEIRKKLAELLSQQFDERVQQQQKEVADLEKQLAELKAVLKKRIDAKTTIVERRIDQLVQEAEGLGWNIQGGPQSPYDSRGFGGGGYAPAAYPPSPAKGTPKAPEALPARPAPAAR